VERPKSGARPIPLPKPVRTARAARNVARFTLSNGIRLIVQENHSTPTLSLRGSVEAGSIVEPTDKPGLASVTAAMLTRGTQNRNALEFATALADMGASLGASADVLAANVSGQAQSKDFDKLADLLTEMLRQPVFPEAQLRNLKARLLAGLAEEKDDPSSLATRAFERSIYPEGSPLRPETLEEAEKALQGITAADVAGFHRRQYSPGSMILVVVGDVKPDLVRTAFEARLGSWRRSTEAKPVPKLDVALQAKAVRQTITLPEKSETAIIFGHAGGLRRSDPDFYAVQVLNQILGGHPLTARLAMTIRDQQGLAYTVMSFFDASLYPGPFEVSLGTNPANAERAIKSLQAEIERIRTSGVTQREVDEAVAYVTGRFPLRLETNAGLAEILWVAEFYKLGNDYIDKYADYYRAVTAAQVNAAARKYLHPNTATLIVVGTPAGPAPVK